jgi:hypothetical protein
MWAIDDDVVPVLAKVFYETLFEQGSASGWEKPTNVASALHKAVGAVRENLGDSEEALIRWVPFVHFGR